MAPEDNKGEGEGPRPLSCWMAGEAWPEEVKEEDEANQMDEDGDRRNNKKKKKKKNNLLQRRRVVSQVLTDVCIVFRHF
jgi:hypothetical protein